MGDNGRATERGWREVSASPDHPLGHLVGHELGDYTIHLLDGPRSRFGARYFRLHLRNGGEICADPVVLGLINRGRHPSENWIEVAGVCFVARFDTGHRSLDPLTSPIGRRVWEALGDCVPDGGHMMVEYESPEWSETARALGTGIPPVATILGYLLFCIGCGVNFKDWYFSEGLHEGPRKLQGWKALDAGHRRRRAVDMSRELTDFLARSNAGLPLVREPRRRATEVLSQLARVLQAEGDHNVGRSSA